MRRVGNAPVVACSSATDTHPNSKTKTETKPFSAPDSAHSSNDTSTAIAQGIGQLDATDAHSSPCSPYPRCSVTCARVRVTTCLAMRFQSAVPNVLTASVRRASSDRLGGEGDGDSVCDCVHDCWNSSGSFGRKYKFKLHQFQRKIVLAIPPVPGRFPAFRCTS